MRMTRLGRSTALVICLLWSVPALGAEDSTGSTTNTLDAIKGWNAEVDDPEVAARQELSPETMASVEGINTYFNEFVHLQGRFVQTDPNNDQTKGRFYVQRPGRLRFDYAPPSKLRIVADGEYLSVEDHDLNTVDKYPLDSTPFRMLLAENVDLFRDAHIVSFAQRSGLMAVTLEDKSGESAGQIKLFFKSVKNSNDIELKEWVITDPQGLDTRIEVVDLESGKEQSQEFFSTTTVAFPTFSE